MPIINKYGNHHPSLPVRKHCPCPPRSVSSTTAQQYSEPSASQGETPHLVPLGSFLTISHTFAKDINEIPQSTSTYASSSDYMLVGFRSSSKYFFHPLMISQVRVSNFPPLTNTPEPGPDFLSWVTERPEAVWGQPKVHHHNLSKLLPHPSFCFCDYLNCRPSGLLVPMCCLRRPLSQPYSKSFLSSTWWPPFPMVSLPHHRVLVLPPQQAPMTFWPQLIAASSTMEALNMADSDSMSTASPGMQVKFFWRWELKTLRTGASARVP